MFNVRRLVETLPEEGLLRDKAWKDIQPIVKIEMAPYAQALRQAVEQQEVAAAPDMVAYAAREADARRQVAAATDELPELRLVQLVREGGPGEEEGGRGRRRHTWEEAA